ncbi:hypothetical protein GQX74_001481 [Glossina fuscipes]|nr:hypothetical protein GQX74_001481 [Glossina fuscipes]
MTVQVALTVTYTQLCTVIAAVVAVAVAVAVAAYFSFIRLKYNIHIIRHSFAVFSGCPRNEVMSLVIHSFPKKIKRKSGVPLITQCLQDMALVQHGSCYDFTFGYHMPTTITKVTAAAAAAAAAETAEAAAVH